MPEKQAAVFSVPMHFQNPTFHLKMSSISSDTRMVNGYRSISLFNQKIKVPCALFRENVELHMIPDFRKQVLEVHVWWNGKLVHNVKLPLTNLRVHF